MKFVSLYTPKFISNIVYMLQQTEYRSKYYLKWLWTAEDFRHIQSRGTLDMTTPARILLAAAWFFVVVVLWFGVSIIVDAASGVNQQEPLWGGILVIIGLPAIAAHLILLPTWLGRFLIIGPRRSHEDLIARGLYSQVKGVKIAVAGSFGKTTMKQILATVLSEGKKIAFTEGNYNTGVAHYRFAKTLKGNEEAVIIEFGEYLPGDIAEFTSVVQPDIAVITGFNEAHLENFKSLEDSAANIMSLAKFVGNDNLYVNGDSEKLLMFTPYDAPTYNHIEVGGWKISGIKITAENVKFNMKKGKRSFKIQSNLIGRHNVGPLAVAVVIADRLKMSKKQIEAGVKKTQPYEHRMQPIEHKGNVLVIDDTYNGNIDGVHAGVELLKELKGKRKVYITPGLVEQGKQTAGVHRQLGELVGQVADVVVLMQNSVTQFIKEGLESVDFKGQLIEVEEPLKFYKNLGSITASGDVVLMQNDWTDAYR